MSDSQLIWKILEKEYPNEHLVIYLYVCGSIKNKKTAVKTAIELIELFCSKTINTSIIKATVEGFFNIKVRLYKSGKITVKTAY